MATRAFVRELLAEVKRETGHRIRDLVVTMPVDAYEGYRAHLGEILRALGVRRLRFLDEPLAAALGYGLGLASDRNVLVVDIGGGTMNVALVRLQAKHLPHGRAEVLAKQGQAYGGNAVDSWILDLVGRRMGFALEELADLEEMRLWRRLMLAEACRVKEALFVEPTAEFLLTPPGLSRRRRSAACPAAQPATLTRDDLVQVLREGGFYAALSGSVERVLAEASSGPMSADDVQDVLMVGGSTLLPGVFPVLEERFGRHRVRAWQPFEAVAFGAASFAADRYAQSDFIVHDYAFLTHDSRTHEPRLHGGRPSRHAVPHACPICGGDSSYRRAPWVRRRRSSSSWCARSAEPTGAAGASPGTRRATSTRSAARRASTARWSCPSTNRAPRSAAWTLRTHLATTGRGSRSPSASTRTAGWWRPCSTCRPSALLLDGQPVVRLL